MATTATAAWDSRDAAAMLDILARQRAAFTAELPVSAATPSTPPVPRKGVHTFCFIFQTRSRRRTPRRGWCAIRSDCIPVRSRATGPMLG